MNKIILVFLLCLASVCAGARKPLPEKIKKQVTSFLEENENLHRAFFDYNESKIKNVASKMAKMAKKIGMSPVKRPIVLMGNDLSKMNKASTRKNLNELYAGFSTKLAAIIKKYDVGANYNIYSCPMVKKTWIQDSSKRKRVHNPYAPEMPHCGQRDTEY